LKNLKFKNLESGVSLIITFFIMMIVLAVVLSVSAILYSEIKVIRNIGDSVIAFYTADAGVEKALYYDRKSENVAEGKHGICYMCANENKKKDQDCVAIETLNNNPAGCDSATCKDCKITFNSASSDLLGNKNFLVTAVVSPGADDPGFSNISINSVGSYIHATGVDTVKRAIQLNITKREIGQTTIPLRVSVIVLPGAEPGTFFVGEPVTFLALPSGGTGDETYTYGWELPRGYACDDGANSNYSCTTSFSAANTHTAVVTVIDAGIPEPQTASGSASVTVNPEMIATKTAFVISPATVGQGGNVNLTATLTNFATGDPIPGKLITFNNGKTSITTGQTNSSGVALSYCDSATCTATMGSYILQAKFLGDSFYSASESPKQTLAVIAPWSCGGPLIDSRDGQTYTTAKIGSQCWMTQNLNVGTMINGSANQGTSCVSIKKYCYSDSIVNCTINKYGGLYQWDQAMCGSTANGAMGICPAGWHIPTHNEWTDLERFVCSSSSCALEFPYNTTTDGWRGTGEGITLRNLDFLGQLAGSRSDARSGSFYGLGTFGHFWSSLSNFDNAWFRLLGLDYGGVGRYKNVKKDGFSVRCIKN
jgi:uncharacterized protein (TIGR02145 family)